MLQCFWRSWCKYLLILFSKEVHHFHYHLVDCFSEDIDLNIETETKPLKGKRKQLKRDVVRVIEKFGLSLTNSENVKSYRGYNRYTIDYPSILGVSYLKEKLIVETAIYQLFLQEKMILISILPWINFIVCLALKKLLLEGRSIINGVFLRAEAVDNISQVIAPIIADKDDKPLFFDSSMTEFRMFECKPMKDGFVWIWYAK